MENARPIACSDLQPRVKLYELVKTHVEILLSNVQAFRIYFAERHLVQDTRDRRMRRGEDTYQRLYVDVIEAGQQSGGFRSGDARVLALLVAGMANSTTRWYTEAGSHTVESLSTLAAEVGVDSVRADVGHGVLTEQTRSVGSDPPAAPTPRSA